MKLPKSRKVELAPNATGGERSHAETAESAEFKMTELGPIPVDWEVKRLGGIAMVARGGSPRPIEAFLTSHDDGLNWVKIGDVGVGAKYIERTAEKILPGGLSSTRMVYPGDFLLSNSMSFGRPYIMKIAGCIHDGWLVIQDYKTTFDTEYLYYVLGSEMVVNQYRVLAAGSSVLNLNKDVVARVTVVVPPLAEQRRIAGALSDVDELISALGKLIEKKRNIKTGAMQELLAGKTRLPGFGANSPRSNHSHAEAQRGRGIEFKQTELGPIPMDWEVKRLGEVAKIGNGKDYKHLPEGNVPVYGTGGLMTYVNACLYDGATVCIGRKGTIDEPQYHEGKIWTVDTLFYTYDFKGVDPKFLYYLFTRINWHSYNSATGVPSLTAVTILGIDISLPPLAEQKAIAAVLSDIDAEIAALEADRAKYERIKSGMMQELLTGKTRLKGE